MISQSGRFSPLKEERKEMDPKLPPNEIDWAMDALPGSEQAIRSLGSDLLNGFYIEWNIPFLIGSLWLPGGDSIDPGRFRPLNIIWTGRVYMGLGLFRKWAVFGRPGDLVKGSRGLKPMLHGSCTLAPGPFREGHAQRPIFSTFSFPSSFFVNKMKRTHQVWSWNAMLTPCLANHVRTDLKTSCHGCGHGFKAGYILSPRRQL
jgi:hypothetical protein